MSKVMTVGHTDEVVPPVAAAAAAAAADRPAVGLLSAATAARAASELAMSLAASTLMASTSSAPFSIPSTLKPQLRTTRAMRVLLTRSSSTTKADPSTALAGRSRRPVRSFLLSSRLRSAFLALMARRPAAGFGLPAWNDDGRWNVSALSAAAVTGSPVVMIVGLGRPLGRLVASEMALAAAELAHVLAGAMLSPGPPACLAGASVSNAMTNLSDPAGDGGLVAAPSLGTRARTTLTASASLAEFTEAPSSATEVRDRLADALEAPRLNEGAAWPDLTTMLSAWWVPAAASEPGFVLSERRTEPVVASAPPAPVLRVAVLAKAAEADRAHTGILAV
mmetsp:Transcript_3233/g.13275  ORF Transcript_3233/g.13275 Transcript_3233/m.13275 type:complete len:336 (-) Transcript_3233:17-1024(-)